MHCVDVRLFLVISHDVLHCFECMIVFTSTAKGESCLIYCIPNSSNEYFHFNHPQDTTSEASASQYNFIEMRPNYLCLQKESYKFTSFSQLSSIHPCMFV